MDPFTNSGSFLYLHLTTIGLERVESLVIIIIIFYKEDSNFCIRALTAMFLIIQPTNNLLSLSLLLLWVKLNGTFDRPSRLNVDTPF